MKAPSPNQIAWLLPLSIFAHQLEEYFFGFPAWFSILLNADLSVSDFIYINTIGLFVFTLLSLSYLFNKNNIIPVALGTLVFVNGWAHLLLSIFTFSYSPGTITSTFLFIPLGLIIFRKISPLLREGERIAAIAIGIIVLISVSVIAMNI